MVLQGFLDAKIIAKATQGDDVTLTGKLECVHLDDDFINEALRKAEQFDEFIATGIITDEALEDSGYRQK